MCASSPIRAVSSPEAGALRTILVTGFEPFGGETVNASWEAARRLDGWRCGERVAVARMLPCVYGACVEDLIEAFERLKPDAVLMTGQAARRGVVSSRTRRAQRRQRGDARQSRRRPPRRGARRRPGAPGSDRAGRRRRARHPRRRRRRPRIDERRRLCLQPSLLRRAPILARRLAGDAGSVPASPGDARADAARRERAPAFNGRRRSCFASRGYGDRRGCRGLAELPLDLTAPKFPTEACFTSRTIVRCFHEGERRPSGLPERRATKSDAALAEIRDARARSATRPRAPRPSLARRRAEGSR